MEEPLKLFTALYNPMVHESGFITLSVHRTKKGAWNAIKRHKIEEFNEWMDGQFYSRRQENWDHFKFDFCKDWRIGTIELND